MAVIPSNCHYLQWHPLQFTIQLLRSQNLEDILVACEFPDFFPEDLSGMPPDWDIEFIIELQPGMTPIFR
jgi:hypothetical protein